MTQPAVQGSKVVLLVKGDTYFEVLSKNGAIVRIMGPAGAQVDFPADSLEAAGLVAVHAHKLVKTDGSWLYMAHGRHGTDLYQNGRHSPAVPLGMSPVRTL
ncbi:MAG: hypothetical protein ACYCZR_00280 [Burkholderiales bacterium]